MSCLRRLNVWLVGAVVWSACSSSTFKSVCPMEVCGEVCADLSADRSHCGSCDTRCPQGADCVHGACLTECSPREVSCDDRCIDPRSDPGYCGASGDCQGVRAGIACRAGEVCTAGVCALSCQQGLVACNGGCVDPLTSRSFCGASSDCLGDNAGTACQPGELCSAGRCALSCREGLAACEGTCINPKINPDYCGVDVDCSGGMACSPMAACSEGTCVENDTRLSALSLSAGKLSPSFDPDRLVYFISSAGRSLVLVPTAFQASSTILVNGAVVASGAASEPISVPEASGVSITIEVTAAAGASRTYSLAAFYLPPINYLKASNTKSNAQFGSSVSLNGDTLVVGAPGESSASTGIDGDQSDASAPGAGAVYVYVRSGSRWVQQAYLKASNTDAGDGFGASVSLWEDMLVVGAPGESSSARGLQADQSDNSAPRSGAVYVFKRFGARWSQEAYVKASNSDPGDEFGYSVSSIKDGFAVGAPGESSSATGIDGDQSDNSAPQAGAVYLFGESAVGGWFEQGYFKASNTDAGDAFGSSISLYQGPLGGFNTYLWQVTLAVGAPGESSAATGIDGDQANNMAPEAGAVYVFMQFCPELSWGAFGPWRQQAYLKASNTDPGDRFGFSVIFDGNAPYDINLDRRFGLASVLVGAPGESSRATGIDGDQSDNSAPRSGAAYLFARYQDPVYPSCLPCDPGEPHWSYMAYLKASNSKAFDGFGFGVSISGNAVGVTAPGEDGTAVGPNGGPGADSANGSGAVYLFDCPVFYGVPACSQAHYLKASNAGSGDALGRSVSLWQGTVAAGAPLEDGAATGVNSNSADDSAQGSGSVYVW